MKSQLTKIKLLSSILFVFISTLAYSNEHNTFTSIKNGIIEYSQLIDGNLNGVIIDLKSGTIQFSFESTNGLNDYELDFDNSDITMTPELLAFNYEKSSFRKNIFTEGQQTLEREAGCMQQAGMLSDLASRMIKEGTSTLVAFGIILRNIALDMIAACISAE